MIDMALSNVLYELIDKSIPAKPHGLWEGKKEVREPGCLPDVATYTSACTHTQTRQGGWRRHPGAACVPVSICVVVMAHLQMSLSRRAL